MTSAAQIKANQRNGKKSKGPASQEGKEISSQNAVIHGVLSDRLLLPNEDVEAIAALEQSIYEVYQPTDAVEHALVERILLSYIRQQRLEQAENAKLNLSMTPELLAIEINESLSLPFGQRVTAEDISINTENQYLYHSRTLKEFEGIDLKEAEHDFPALEAKAPYTWLLLGTKPKEYKITFEQLISNSALVTQALTEIKEKATQHTQANAHKHRAYLIAQQLKIAKRIPDGKDFDLISKYQSQIDNEISRAVDQFKRHREWKTKIIEAEVLQ